MHHVSELATMAGVLGLGVLGPLLSASSCDMAAWKDVSERRKS